MGCRMGFGSLLLPLGSRMNERLITLRSFSRFVFFFLLYIVQIINYSLPEAVYTIVRAIQEI